MKYYLIIGYQLLEKYKEFPIVRVYINKQLVDEFKCDSEQTTKISAKTSIKNYYSAEYYDTSLYDSTIHEFTAPKKYKVIEVDSSSWTDKENLVLEVSHNRSDYTNGFMNKRSLVSFGVVFLIRKDIFDSTSKMHRIIKKFHTTEKTHRIRYPHPGQFPRWPGVTNHAGAGTDMDVANAPRGGNFKKQFTIKKKHRTHMLVFEDVQTKGYFFLDRFFLAWYQYYSKIPFELTTIDKSNLNTGKRTVSVEIKEINTSNEDQ